jgi:antitoxin component of RelBE/YafQ-DinJ toxin-antitoxin module
MAKLTLSVDERVVARAKQYAKHQGVSISEMVEAYLATVADPLPSATSDTPILRAVRGVLKSGNISDYRKHLAAKYR